MLSMGEVYLDNNDYFDCTPDHPCMLRDGTYKEAKELQPAESLMPLYQRISKFVGISTAGHRENFIHRTFKVFIPTLGLCDIVKPRLKIQVFSVCKGVEPLYHVRRRNVVPVNDS